MDPIIVRRSRSGAVLTVPVVAILGTAGVLAIVQGGRPILGGSILLIAFGLGASVVRAFRDRGALMQLDDAGVHYREGKEMRTLPWADIEDVRPVFDRGRSHYVRVTVGLAMPYTPPPSWWHRLLRRAPAEVRTQEFVIPLFEAGVSGVDVAATILRAREEWIESVADQVRGHPRPLRRLIRGDFS